MKILTRSCLFLLTSFCFLPQIAAATGPAPEKTPYLSFGMRLGEDMVEGYSDLIYPLFTTTDNILFVNPRLSLKDGDENELNIGLGYRHKLTGWLIGGVNGYFDSRESEHDNRFNQWGVGLELFSDYIDFRANYYDADNDREVIGSYGRRSTETSTRVSYSGFSRPFATNHEIVSERIRTTRTTTTITDMLFEQYEAGLDGWDTEIGCKLPFPVGPEVRLFAGYYDYDNPLGEDLSGGRGRIEVRTGSWLTLDAEVFEDKELNDSDYFVGFRLQIPLSADLSWEGVKAGLLSTRHRDLDERMRGEMVVRDVRVQTKESDWQENRDRRLVTVSQVEKRRKERLLLADHITFVDGDNSRNGQDGTNENPYDTIQEGVDQAGENKTIFVYEKGGTVSRPSPDDGGSSYDEQVVLQEGQTLTSTISWTTHGGGVYQTERRPVIRPTRVRVEKTGEVFGTIVSIAPVITMAPGTTVRRLDIDATATDFAAYSSTGLRVSAGLYADIRKKRDISLRAEDNHVRTKGDLSYGILVLAEESASADIMVSDSEFVTAGENAHGIYVNVDNSTDASIAVSDSAVTTAGESASGMYVLANSSANANIMVSDSELTTAGDYAPGMFVSADNSTDADIMVSDSTLTTTGEGTLPGIVSLGIGVSAISSTNAEITVSESVISTVGDNAYGLAVDVDDSTNAEITISDAAFTTAGDNAPGIFIVADAMSAITNTVQDNTLTIDGVSWGIDIVNDTTGSFNQAGLEADNTFDLSPVSSGTVRVTP